MDDDQSQDAPITLELAPVAVEPISDQPTGSGSANMSPTTLESPINDDSSTSVEDQNPPINQLESKGVEEPISAPNEPEASVDDQSAPATDELPIFEPVQPMPVQSIPISAPTPLTPTAAQTQPSAQQNQSGFIHGLLIKAQAKIQSNKQKKLNEIIQLAQKKQTIKNEDVQKLLRISSATATRYLVKLVEQGHLTRIGSPRDAKYQFVQ
jgi:hypothetical protein